MADLTELKKTLRDLAPDPGFVMDNRSSELILDEMYNYVAQIPFSGDGFWNDIFFMAGNSPEKLAQLYEDRGLADGTLYPHQAFLLAFLDLLETPRALLNYVPVAHRDLYYRGLLGVHERTARPDSVALAFELSGAVREQFLPAGTLFDGGQDRKGAPVQYALDQSLLVNRGAWTDLRWVQPGPPNGDDASIQVASVPYDQQDQVAWPNEGVRLFNTDASQTVVTGRMVTSAVLAMPVGDRTIRLTFSAAVDSSTLTARVSGGDHWLDLVLPSPATNETSVVLTLAAEADAIAAPRDLDGITADTPFLKLGRNDGDSVPTITALSVMASGNSDVHYSTDYGVDRLDNVSYPFGTTPVVGSGFNLIAASWCNQTAPVTLTLTPEWIGLPATDFATWYEGYDKESIPASNSDYKVQPFLVSATGSQPLPAVIGGSSDPQSLFSGDKGEPPVPATLTIALPPSLLTRVSDRNNPCDWPQWLRLELYGRDFGYQDYLSLAGTPGLNRPYTPQMKSLLVSYTIDTPAFTQYVLTPFGYASDSSPPADDPAHAYLYLGLTDAQPGDTLSLYWQLQSPQKLNINWQYLNENNQWASLDDTVVDGTQGLLGSGLWSALLADDAVDSAAQMPTGRYWVRAVIAIDTSSLSDSLSAMYDYPWLRGINTNSMTATLNAPQAIAASHFLQPLAAGTVTRPVKPVSGVKSVEQPWPSTGGQPPELPAQFFSRIAQRLSHRNRALTWRDMASLLKSQYADVFDVSMPPVDVMTRLSAPSQQTLLVIPVNARKDNEDSLRPMFSQAHLTDMGAYLQPLASPWASIVLVNPTYTDVDIAYDVSFNINPDYGYRKLRELLTLHYMPWAWDRQSGVTLANTLDYYGIIALIQQQSFVVQVISLTLNGQHASVQGGEQEVLVLSGFETASNSSEKDRA